LKVGVTGATGFIGRHVLAALEAGGVEVCALVRNSSTLPDVETRAIDFSDTNGLEGRLDEVLAGLDAVVHGAAHVPADYNDPSEARLCLEVNALGTLALLEASKRAELVKVAVYSGNVYRFGSDPVDEDGPIYPSARAPYYMISKACADFYADAVLREGKLDIAILRPAAVYGPGLGRGMIPRFIARLESRQSVVIKDADGYRADLVYVEDVAAATVTALHESMTGPFNLGSGTTSTPLEIARTLVELLDVPKDLIEVRTARETEPMGFSPLNIQRARGAFGYQPRSMRQGLSDYVDWWRTQS